MAVHKFPVNMEDGSDLFIFGDDFDAILDALEDDVQGQIDAAVVQVRILSL